MIGGGHRAADAGRVKELAGVCEHASGRFPTRHPGPVPGRCLLFQAEKGSTGPEQVRADKAGVRSFENTFLQTPTCASHSRMTKPHPQRLPAPAAPSSPTGPATPAPADNPDDFGFSAPDYDPDEYRWVPVRRRARYDGWTEEKQRRFIEVLADTGLVSAACKEVGMTRASAYRLRRAAHAGAFARAWDRARELAGALIEDIAFERALEGVEVETYDGNGELSGVRTVYNDRLLTFLLRHLKPETYSAAARERRGGALLPASGPNGQGPNGGDASLDEALRAMEPEPPAPPEQLVGPDQLETDLLTAEVADGQLPPFLSEQRAPRSRRGTSRRGTGRAGGTRPPRLREGEGRGAPERRGTAGPLCLSRSDRSGPPAQEAPAGPGGSRSGVISAYTSRHLSPRGQPRPGAKRGEIASIARHVPHLGPTRQQPRGTSPMQVQFNSDSSVMGTHNVAERIEARVRERLARFADRLSRIEIHVRDENGAKGGADDKACTIEARPRGGQPIGVTGHAATVDDAANRAAGTLAQRLERHFGKEARHGHDPRPEKA